MCVFSGLCCCRCRWLWSPAQPHQTSCSRGLMPGPSSCSRSQTCPNSQQTKQQQQQLLRRPQHPHQQQQQLPQQRRPQAAGERACLVLVVCLERGSGAAVCSMAGFVGCVCCVSRFAFVCVDTQRHAICKQSVAPAWCMRLSSINGACVTHCNWTPHSC